MPFLALVARRLDRICNITDERAHLHGPSQANARLGRREDQAADLDKLERLTDSGELRCRVLNRRIELLGPSADRHGERNAIDALRTKAAELRDPAWLGRAAAAEARFFMATSDFPAAAEAAEEALASFDVSGTTRDRIEALLALSDAKQSMGTSEDAGRLAARAVAIARKNGDRDLIARAAMQGGLVKLRTARSDGSSLALFEEALKEYRAAGDRVGEANALAWVASCATWLMQWERARVALHDAGRLLEVIDDRRGQAHLAFSDGLMHLRCGDLRRARTLMAESARLYRELGDLRRLATALGNEASIAVWQGQASEAKQLALAGLDIARDIDHPAGRIANLCAQGSVEKDIGELDESLAHFSEAFGLISQWFSVDEKAVSVMTLIALVQALRGEIDSALHWARRAHAFGTSPDTFPPEPPWVNARVFHWAAEYDLAREALRRASELMASAITSFDDPEMRAQYEALPFCKGIAEAVEGRWPPAPWET